MGNPQMQEYIAYIGTYTSGSSEGLYIYRFDAITGSLRYDTVVTGPDNPSFLALHPKQPFLYSVGETNPGTVYAFAVQRPDGYLTLLNQKPSLGNGPCYLSLDQAGSHVFVANYNSGSVAVLPVAPDGSLRDPVSVWQHQGSSVRPGRQEGPHAHSILAGPTGRLVFAADLGNDRIMTYGFDQTQGKLSAWTNPWTQLPPGAGPRHLVFADDGRFAYLVNELDSTVVVFQYDLDGGVLEPIQTLSALPAGFDGESTAADIHLHPTGRFLYASNRGHDSIVVYAVDALTGKLSYISHHSTEGRTPRNFAIDPTGNWLLVANQGSDTVVSFHVDEKSGQLEPAGRHARVPAPVCITFLTEKGICEKIDRMRIELRELSINDGREVYEMLKEIGPGENGFANSGYDISFSDFPDYLRKQANMARGIGLKPEHVPQT